jgi:hypothetical protein
VDPALTAGRVSASDAVLVCVREQKQSHGGCPPRDPDVANGIVGRDAADPLEATRGPRRSPSSEKYVK